MFSEELEKIKQSETYAKELQKKAKNEAKQSLEQAKTQGEKIVEEAEKRAEEIQRSLIQEGQREVLFKGEEGGMRRSDGESQE